LKEHCAEAVFKGDVGRSLSELEWLFVESTFVRLEQNYSPFCKAFTQNKCRGVAEQ